MHSAGLAVVREVPWRETDLRVDWSEEPDRRPARGWSTSGSPARRLRHPRPRPVAWRRRTAFPGTSSTMVDNATEGTCGADGGRGRRTAGPALRAAARPPGDGLGGAPRRPAGSATSLEDAGFAVTPAYLGLETAFLATYGSGPFRLGLCAEYDALPGLGHACGHNLIAAITVGAARRARAAGRRRGSHDRGLRHARGGGRWRQDRAARPRCVRRARPGDDGAPGSGRRRRGASRSRCRTPTSPTRGRPPMPRRIPSRVSTPPTRSPSRRSPSGLLRQQLPPSVRVHGVDHAAAERRRTRSRSAPRAAGTSGPRRLERARRGRGEGLALLRGRGPGHRLRRSRSPRRASRTPSSAPTSRRWRAYRQNAEALGRDLRAGTRRLAG